MRWLARVGMKSWFTSCESHDSGMQATMGSEKMATREEEPPGLAGGLESPAAGGLPDARHLRSQGRLPLRAQGGTSCGRRALPLRGEGWMGACGPRAQLLLCSPAPVLRATKGDRAGSHFRTALFLPRGLGHVRPRPRAPVGTSIREKGLK